MVEKKVSQKKQEKVGMKISNEVSQGHYVNATSVIVADSEVVVDFGYIFPSDTVDQQGVIVSRVIMNHDMTNKLVKLLSDTLKNHKAKDVKTSK